MSPLFITLLLFFASMSHIIFGDFWYGIALATFIGLVQSFIDFKNGVR